MLRREAAPIRSGSTRPLLASSTRCACALRSWSTFGAGRRRCRGVGELRGSLEQSRAHESEVLALRRRLQDESDQRDLELARLREEVRREERAQALKVAEAKVESKFRDERAKIDGQLQAAKAANIALSRDLRERETHIERLERNARSLSQTAAAGPRHPYRVVPAATPCLRSAPGVHQRC